MEGILTFVKIVLYGLGFGLLIPLCLAFFVVGGCFLFVFCSLGLIAYAPLFLAEYLDDKPWKTLKKT